MLKYLDSERGVRLNERLRGLPPEEVVAVLPIEWLALPADGWRG